MKIFKYISILLIILSISCCVNQKKKDEDQIKNTVREYWKAVKTNDVKKCMDLIFESEGFEGGVHADLYFLHKNYNKINSNHILLNKPIIRDTIMELNSKHKYVKYNFINQRNENLSLILFFFSGNGFNKITREEIIGNMPKWEK